MKKYIFNCPSLGVSQVLQAYRVVAVLIFHSSGWVQKCVLSDSILGIVAYFNGLYEINYT